MKNHSTLFYCLSLSLLVTGCANKKCVGEDKHDGLFNALTCDYESDIIALQSTLDNKTLERNRLFHNYQRLIAKTLNKQGKIDALNQNIQEIEQNMNAVSALFQKVKSAESNPIDLLKLKQKLRTLNNTLVKKAIYFEVKDAVATKKKLTVTHKKNSYIEASKKTPHQDFSQMYQEDINKDKEIKLSLSSDISNISTKLNGTNIAQMENEFKQLMVKLEKYNQSKSL